MYISPSFEAFWKENMLYLSIWVEKVTILFRFEDIFSQETTPKDSIQGRIFSELCRMAGVMLFVVSQGWESPARGFAPQDVVSRHRLPCFTTSKVYIWLTAFSYHTVQVYLLSKHQITNISVENTWVVSTTPSPLCTCRSFATTSLVHNCILLQGAAMYSLHVPILRSIILPNFNKLYLFSLQIVKLLHF